MKYTKLLSLPALSLIVMSAGITPIRLIYVSTNEIYGPFDSDRNTDIYFSVTPILSAIDVTVDVYNNKNDSFLFSRSIKLKQPFDQCLHLDTKGRITSSGIRLEIKFESGMTFLLTKSLVLYPPKRNTLIASNNIVSFTNCLFNIERNTFITDEEYDFTPVNSFISSDNENKIDVSETTFKYSLPDAFKCTKAELQIIDYENIYPNISSSDNIKRIPLDVNVNSKDVFFSLNSGMYVNHNTLEMSSDYIFGYTQTNSFFVPIGKENDLSKNEIKIVLYESGFNLNTIEIPLEYFNISKVFGSCGESDYCIHGGIKEWFCYF